MTLTERIAAGERLTADELAEWNNRGLTRRPTWCDDAGVIRSEGAVTWWFPPEEPDKGAPLDEQLPAVTLAPYSGGGGWLV